MGKMLQKDSKPWMVHGYAFTDLCFDANLTSKIATTEDINWHETKCEKLLKVLFFLKPLVNI